MTDDNDVELAGDLPYIGRSTTKIPDNMTKEHIMKKFTYATTQTQTWSGHKCYYSIYESRGFMNYLGFKHNATGVIFSLYNTYSGKVGTTTVHLDGTKSEAYNWHAHYDDDDEWESMMSEINAIDSKLSNWNVIRMEVREEVKDYFHDLNIVYHSNPSRMTKGDLSMIFKQTDILQKGMADVKDDYELIKKNGPIEIVNEMKEMIV